jgi:cysteine desulfurase/selenocysteine lyase
MNIQKIRQDFASLSREVSYFDNAWMSLRPKQVIAAVEEYYQKYPACGSRSLHRWGKIVTDKCEAARKLVADFINAKKPEEVVFVKNTTEGLNLVAHSLDFQPGDKVITTGKEHNSNLIPWQILVQEKKIEHLIVPSPKDGSFDLTEFTRLLEQDNVKLVSMVLTSNLDGTTIPAKKIIKLAHDKGVLVMLDAAQTVAHQPVDVRDLDVDFIAFSGHKMLGPTGVGVLYGKYRLLEKLKPFLVGGDTVSSTTYTSFKLLPPPEKFEAGLQNYAGIIGLGAAVQYLQKIGFKAIKQQEEKLNQLISLELAKLPQVTVLGPESYQKRNSLVSFIVKGKDSHQVALLLDELAAVLVRSGQHCVHSWFAAHQLKSSVRASFAFYNTQAEAEIFLQTLKQILEL